MTTLFISDIHLDSNRPEISQAFIRFLNKQAVKAETLYILGDLFEFWIGDDYQKPYQNEILALHETVKKGVKIYFMHGNRDFMVGNKLANDIGCEILDDPTVIHLYGQSILLSHGDVLCTEDTAYMKFRHYVRDKKWQDMMLAKPVEERLNMANQLRGMSQTSNSNKAENIMDVTPSEVIKMLEAHNVKLMIHGHTHRPAIHSLTTKLGNSKRIVLGDWSDFGWVLKFNSNGYSLDSFSVVE